MTKRTHDETTAVQAQEQQQSQQQQQQQQQQRPSQKRRKKGPTESDIGLKVDMLDFLKSFPELGKFYELVGKIGEGTFSTVYKAVDVAGNMYDNSNWYLKSLDMNEENKWTLDDEHIEAQEQEEAEWKKALQTLFFRYNKKICKTNDDDGDPEHLKAAPEILEAMTKLRNRSSASSSSKQQNQKKNDTENEKESENASKTVKDVTTSDVEGVMGDVFLNLPNVSKCMYKFRKTQNARYVALKRIYANSSPTRILNEIQILYRLRNSHNVARIITAVRNEDQVVLVLPYFHHDDFRNYFLHLSFPNIVHYFYNLFCAIRDIHDHKIIHRDIKPSNFLYNVMGKRGILVDFGLAEKDDYTDFMALKAEKTPNRSYLAPQSTVEEILSKPAPEGYMKTDPRPSIRANRAGTRGFRAPEVLFKVQRQTVALDIWSAGVMLLCFLTRQFPFFQSNDDIEALIELSNLFGKKEMRECAALHRRKFFTNIPTIPENRIGWKKLVAKLNPRGFELVPDTAYDFLDKCLTLNPEERITARQALKHPFLNVENMEKLWASEKMKGK